MKNDESLGQKLSFFFNILPNITKFMNVLSTYLQITSIKFPIHFSETYLKGKRLMI